ncbi:MAG TPA: DNA repair protein RecO [Firmicutes bacterium]|nr:DNA repair protein RecO [Bacillota bacterium]
MPLYSTEAIVLRTRPLGEADVLVTLLTRVEGKVEAAARGARRGRSRLLAATQPFTESRLMLWRGRSLDSLSQAEVLESFRGLQRDLLRLSCATYAAALLDHFLGEREPNPAAYGLCREVFGYFSRAEGRDQLLKGVHAFELRLLRILGYEPEVSRCAACGGGLGSTVRFSLALGGALCAQCFPRDPQALRVSTGALALLSRLAETPWDRLQVIDARGQAGEVRRLLWGFIDFRREGALKARQFLELVCGEPEEGVGGK